MHEERSPIKRGSGMFRRQTSMPALAGCGIGETLSFCVEYFERLYRFTFHRYKNTSTLAMKERSLTFTRVGGLRNRSGDGTTAKKQPSFSALTKLNHTTWRLNSRLLWREQRFPSNTLPFY